PTPPPIYTLSLHDALPISPRPACARTSTSHVLPPLAIEMRLWRGSSNLGPPPQGIRARAPWSLPLSDRHALFVAVPPWGRDQARSEEHTSELQSRSDLVCR